MVHTTAEQAAVEQARQEQRLPAIPAPQEERGQQMRTTAPQLPMQVAAAAVVAQPQQAAPVDRVVEATAAATQTAQQEPPTPAAAVVAQAQHQQTQTETAETAAAE